MQIKDKVCVVTGGASGLGEATVRRFISEGGFAAIIDMDKERGTALATELGERAVYYHTDVSSTEEAEETISRIVNELGSIHVLTNIAGIGKPRKILGKDGPIPQADFAKVIDVNLMGTVNMLRLAAAEMMKNEPNEDGERGVIINTSSIASFHGQPGQAAYSASKGAINSLSLPAAREFAKKGIRVCAIAPGLFMTPLYKTPGLAESLEKDLVFPRRFGKPEEFADMACFIVKNPMLNGDTIRLDGAVRF